MKAANARSSIPSLHSIYVFYLCLLISMQSFGAIYGNDDRRDLFQTSFPASMASSIAIAVPGNFVQALVGGNYRVTDVETLAGSSGANACKDERFANQPTIGNCTGFLVGDRYMITAGHCVVNVGVVDKDENSPFCANFKWYFDFNLTASAKTTVNNIPANRLYSCKRVIRAEVIDNGADFAVVELDRPVSKDMIPLTINSARPTVGSAVFTVGHPMGLPAKHSGISSVVAADKAKDYFEAYLDTEGGNSGGPVFNKKNEVIGILVSGHQIDLYTTPQGCSRVNKCNANGTQCNENSMVSTLQTSNYIQYIAAALKYLPKR